ncbi:MAG: ABC transporter ATP-binding protein [Ectothiorhodospiraceae bacterium]|nr:ABC transporter ATP-binding protein [Chromatiales bacterium]MCP5157027.1 ABC transporter ATP-binding protein [Ectothiorhodospiraceae bacterium]
MSRLPRIGGEGRARGIATVVALALGQAAAAAVAAFATRDIFARFGSEAAGLPLADLAMVAAAGLSIAALRIAERVVAERVGQHYASALRLRLFVHLTRMSAREVARRRTGELALRFVGDLTAVRGWVSQGFARLVSASIVLPLVGVVLFVLDPRLGLAAAVPIAVGLLLMALLGPRLGPAHRRLRARRARLAADMSERLPHAPELRLLGRVGIEKRHLLRRTEHMVTAALVRARGAALLRGIPDAVSGIAAASLFLVALERGLAGAEAAGALAAVGLMMAPMRDLAGVWDRHRAWVAARDKCEALLAVRPLARGRDAGAARESGPVTLELARVSGGRLRKVSASAAAGEKIAIVGGNGAGKSTLLALAAGLEHPSRGGVLIDGRTTDALSQDARQRRVTLIGPRSPILAGSLRRALTMGVATQPTDAEIVAQAEAFGLGDLLVRLRGLDGRVSEGGRNLSSGEVRRVLLTRAALASPGLLLLDEPDDALDGDGPALVERLVRGSTATTLVVTHDLALARRMDRLWFVQDGKVVETGPPAELLASGGPTARHFAPRSAA